MIIALIVLLIAAFACGFGAVYGANRLAENYAYLFEKPSNPTFSRPRDRDTQELPPVDPPMEQTPQDEPNDPVELPDEPIPEIPQSETGTFAEQGNVVFPVLDAPRIKLESSAGLRKMSVADIAEKLSPSVVSIVAYLSDSDQEGYFLGTGTIYSSDGYILTNYHVIEEAVRVKVLLSDGTEYTASHISSDETADIAILKIDAPFERTEVMAQMKPARRTIAREHLVFAWIHIEISANRIAFAFCSLEASLVWHVDSAFLFQQT